MCLYMQEIQARGDKRTHKSSRNILYIFNRFLSLQ